MKKIFLTIVAIILGLLILRSCMEDDDLAHSKNQTLPTLENKEEKPIDNQEQSQLKTMKAKAQDVFYLGKIYQAKQEPTKALRLFEEAAQLGDSQAQYELAIAYLKGLGVEVNQNEAFKLAQLSAQQGNHNAQYLLYQLYFDGIGIAKDDAQALKWLKNSAQQGNKDAIEIFTKDNI